MNKMIYFKFSTENADFCNAKENKRKAANKLHFHPSSFKATVF